MKLSLSKKSEGVTAVSRRFLAGALVSVIVCSALVAIFRSDPVRIADALLHDAGIWATNHKNSSKPLGRVNAEIGQLEVGVSAANLSKPDVVQHDGDVMLVTPDDDAGPEGVAAVSDPIVASFAPVLTAGAALKPPTRLPANTHLAFGGGAVAVRTGGNIWYASSVAEFEAISPKDAGGPPLLKDANDARVVIGVDKTAFVYQGKTGRLRVIRDGAVVRDSKLSALAEVTDVTVVGRLFVALGREQGKQVLLVDGRKDLVDISGLSATSTARLQQPSGPHHSVFLAGATSLARVPLDGANVVTIKTGLRGKPVPPVAIGACVTAAWEGESDRGMPFNSCDDSPTNVYGSRRYLAGHLLRVRVNRSTAFVNDVSDGTIAGIRQGEVFDITADAWDDIFDPNQTEEGKGVDTPQTECDKGTPKAPEANDDVYGARVKIPTLLKVLENDKDSAAKNCRVLAITKVQPLDTASQAKISIASGGQSLLLTADRAGPIRFNYFLDNGFKDDKATVEVTVFEVSDNAAAPEANDDGGADKKFIVKAGTTATINVLANDRDPQGDPLIATIKPSKERAVSGVTASAAPDGTVTVAVAPGAKGERSVRYSLTDDLLKAAKDDGTITVNISDKDVRPTARNDYLRTRLPQSGKGRGIVVDLVANDIRGSGGALTIMGVPTPVVGATSKSGIVLNADNTISVMPAGAHGKFLFRYQVSDGKSTAEALFRLDLDKFDSKSHRPVAGSDLVRMRSDGTALVEVLRNDYDVDGDLLSVTKVELLPDPRRPNGAVAVQAVVVDNARVRIAVVGGGEFVPSLEYTITDGTDTATGVITAFARDPQAENQPPEVVDDRGSMRKGGVGEFAVLVNDIDPDADALELVSVSRYPSRELDPAKEGVAIINGDSVRVVAAENAVGATLELRYEVSDGSPNRRVGRLTVNLLDASGTNNRGPNVPGLTVRVPRGEALYGVKLPIAGSDPENDAVTVVGVSDPPHKGVVTKIEGSTFEYQADDDSVGTDMFRYQVRDTFGAITEAEVRIALLPGGTQTAPFAFPDRIRVRPGSVMPIAVLANDSYFGTAEVIIAVTPDSGSADKIGNIVKFTAPQQPPVGGVIHFSYQIKVGSQISDQTPVTVILDPKARLHQSTGVDNLVDTRKGLLVKVLDNDRDVLYGKDGLRVAQSLLPTGVTVTADRKALTIDESFLERTKAGPVSFVYRVENVLDKNVGADDYIAASAVVTLPGGQDIPKTQIVRKRIKVGGFVTIRAAEFVTSAPAGAEVRMSGLPVAHFGSVAKSSDGKTFKFTANREYGGIGSVSVDLAVGSAEFHGLAVINIEGNQRPKMQGWQESIVPDDTFRIDLERLIPKDPGKHTFKLVGAPGAQPDQWSWGLRGTTFEVRTTPIARQGGKPLVFTFLATDDQGAPAIDTAEVSIAVSAVRAPTVPTLDVGEISKNKETEVRLDVLAQARSFVKKNKQLTIIPSSVAVLDGKNKAQIVKIGNKQSILVVFDNDYTGPVVVDFAVQDATLKPSGVSRGRASFYLYDLAVGPQTPLRADPASKPRVDVPLYPKEVRVELVWSGSQTRGTPILEWEYKLENSSKAGLCGHGGEERCTIAQLDVNKDEEQRPLISVRPIIKGDERPETWSKIFDWGSDIDLPPADVDQSTMSEDFVDGDSVRLSWNTPQTAGSDVKKFIIYEFPNGNSQATPIEIARVDDNPQPGSANSFDVNGLDYQDDVWHNFAISTLNGANPPLESPNKIAFDAVRPVALPDLSGVVPVDTSNLDTYYQAAEATVTVANSVAIRGGDDASRPGYVTMQLEVTVNGKLTPIDGAVAQDQTTFTVPYTKDADYTFKLLVQNRASKRAGTSPASSPVNYQSLATPDDTVISKKQDEANRISFSFTKVTTLKRVGVVTKYFVFDGSPCTGSPTTCSNLLTAYDNASAGIPLLLPVSPGDTRPFSVVPCYEVNSATVNRICGNVQTMQARVYGDPGPVNATPDNGQYTGSSYTVNWAWNSSSAGCNGDLNCRIVYDVSGAFSLSNTTATQQQITYNAGSNPSITVTARLNVPNSSSRTDTASFSVTQPNPQIQFVKHGSAPVPGCTTCYYLSFNVRNLPFSGSQTLTVHNSVFNDSCSISMTIDASGGGNFDFGPDGKYTNGCGAYPYYWGGYGAGQRLTITIGSHSFSQFNWAGLGANTSSGWLN